MSTHLRAFAWLGLSLVLRSQADPSRILHEALGPSPMMRNLEELCDRFGGRLPGTPAHQRAVRWALDGFRDAGLQPRLEPFSLPARWEPGPVSVEVTGPWAFTPKVASWGWSTNANGDFRLVDGGYGSKEELEALGASARGAFILIRSRPLDGPGDLYKAYLQAATFIPVAKGLGAAGLLTMSDRPRQLLYRQVENGDGRPSSLPELLVAREDGLRMIRMLEEGQDVKLRVAMANRLGAAFEVPNIVAEIPGTDLKDEIVAVGASLDSWDLGTGALSDGANAAAILELARLIQASGLHPRRTIRLVLFSGGTLGFVGSRAYIDRHPDELDRHRALLIYDGGPGRVTGYSTDGQEAWIPTVLEILSPLGATASDQHDNDAFIGVLSYDFLLQGIPTLMGNKSWSAYTQDFHAQSDTLDKVDARTLRDQVIEEATLLWGLANTRNLPPRRTRAEIDATLRASHLDQDMKTFGMWEEWASGKRGRK